MNIRWRIAQQFEKWWWQNYLKNKDVSSYLDWKKKYWLKFFKEIEIEIPAQEYCLDIGCGPAGIFTILENNEVVAVDPLLQYYESLPHFQPSHYPNVCFHENTLEDFQSERKFDTIFCINAINHVADIQNSILKLAHLLKPNGRLIISIDAHRYKLLQKVFHAIPGDILHPHQYTREEYHEMISQSGLTIESSFLIQSEMIFNYYCFVYKK
jgi:2-polyprenyl-6-hydroxyphenyl methylase/3-demethylubiquinone-9 3-methyltransferase